MDCLETRVGTETSDIPLSVTWPMIHEMRRGGITIGSHTRSHVSLPLETPADVKEELEGSKRVLEADARRADRSLRVSRRPVHAGVVSALHEAGYRYAYTACTHGDATHPALTLERLLLWEGSSIDADGEFSSAVFNCQIHDLWPPARRCERTHQV